MAYGRKRISRKRVSRRSRTTPFKKAPVKRLVRNYKTKQLVKLIKGVQLKNCETCYKTTKFSVAPVPAGQNFMNGNVYHNSISKLALWYDGSAAFPLQGTGDGERRGDEILMTGIKIRLVMQIPYDRRNSKFRFYFVKWNLYQGDPQNKSNLFHQAINNVMIDAMQTDRFTIKKLGSARLYSTDQPADSQDKTIIKSFWIPIKKKITFTSDGTRQLAKGLPELGDLLITGYDSVTTLETDLLCTNIQAAMTVYYKDP